MTRSRNRQQGDQMVNGENGHASAAGHKSRRGRRFPGDEEKDAEIPSSGMDESGKIGKRRRSDFEQNTEMKAHHFPEVGAESKPNVKSSTRAEEYCSVMDVWNYVRTATTEELNVLYDGRERVCFGDLPWLQQRLTIIKKLEQNRNP